jgi:hypothetical protein
MNNTFLNNSFLNKTMNYFRMVQKHKPVYNVSIKKECCGEACEFVVNALQKVKESVIIIAYKFDNVIIFNMLQIILKKGIKVTMILDYKKNWQNKFVRDLRDLGADIKLWKKTEKLHAKFIIVDDTHVLTGSFNLTSENTTLSQQHEVDLIIGLYDYCAVTRFQSIYKDMMDVLAKDICDECDGNQVE